jgi:hypothetical protein
MSAWEQRGGVIGLRATGDLDDEMAALEALRFAHEDDDPLLALVAHTADAPRGGARESLVTVPPAVASVPLPRRRSASARLFAALAVRTSGRGSPFHWAILVSSITIALPSGLLLGRGLASHPAVSANASTNAVAEGLAEGVPETRALASAAPSAAEETAALSPPSASSLTDPALVRPGRPSNHGRRRFAPKASSIASSASNSDKGSSDSTPAR